MKIKLFFILCIFLCSGCYQRNVVSIPEYLISLKKLNKIFIYDANDVLQKVYVYEYDKNNNAKKEIVYDSLKQIQHYVVFEYTAKNYLIKWSQFDASGVLQSYN